MKISLDMCFKHQDYEISIDGYKVTFLAFISRMGPPHMCGSHRDPSEPKREVLLPPIDRYTGAYVDTDRLETIYIDGERYTVTNPEYLQRQIPDDWNDRHLRR